ncbi:FAD-binding protein, partial [Acidobacteria bacterium AH-259-D05]|nr:FAD-binding protein [Acidobacteria bacterium AH-259-D05]
MDKTQVARFEEELRQSIKGDVLFDEMSRLMYSTDASLYQIKPLGVVLPQTREEIFQTIQIAVKYQVPLLPRGGGTSLAGQTVLDGLVVDCSKHLYHILEINQSERWVRVEPGTVLDNLNEFLKPHNLHFAPDPATSSRANIGGMIGNNSSGVRSIRYGKTVDHILEVSVLLATGEELLLRNLNAQELQEKCSHNDREGEIYRKVRQIVEKNSQEITRRFPHVMRRVGGYNLDLLLQENEFNLAKLIVGSEGTLAFVTEAKLNLEPIPSFSALSVLHFDDLIQAIEAVPVLLQYNPSAIEILDHYGLELARSNPAVAPLVAQFIQGTPQAILWVEFSGESKEEVHSGWTEMKANLEHQKGFYNCYDAGDEQAKQVVWDLRKHSLGILLGMKGDAKPLPFIEDACVPVEHLSEYVTQVLDFCRHEDRPVALYAHASAGVIHIRPILNLKQQEDVTLLRQISAKAFDLVCKYAGSWSGEHGDGLVRSYKNREFFGEQLYQAFREIKRTFDPMGLMNPGKIVDAQDLTENLRIHPDYRTDFPDTYFQFKKEQGFDKAIEICTGVGHCRKTTGGTMCPSYMATRDEEHSTRGRANALRLAIAGELGPDGLTSQRLYEVLDLCLECKACKSECPSGVDMARLKSEFLAHYYTQHHLPLGKKLVSKARETAQWASHFPRLSNFVLDHSGSRWLLEKLAGIDRRRHLPQVAQQTFAAWFRKNQMQIKADPTAETVALLADTFTNFYEPNIAIAATRLLRSLNYQILLADAGCCGRPLISTGQLGAVKKKGPVLIRALKEYANQQIPIVVLEPSCLATLRDDYPDLLDNKPACQLVVEHLLSLEEFLSGDEVWPRLTDRMGEGPAEILFHGHCQQKALVGTESSLKTLGSLKETRLREVDSGCCGMAGSFGYEKKHYQISEKIGERRLFPAVRDASPDTEIVASGFSCRSQIRHFTGRSAKHLAETLAHYL